MKITPSDITNKTFKKSIRGYDADEVDEFLDLIVKDYEGLYKDNSALKEKIDALSDQLERFLKMENTIQNTLVLAQDASENAKQAAQREADLILKTAQDTARKTIDTSQQKAMMISRDYETIKQDFFKFKASYRNFVTSQLELFNSMEKEMNRNYDILEKNSNSNNTYNYIEGEYKNKVDPLNRDSFNSPNLSENLNKIDNSNYISSNVNNNNLSNDDDYLYTGQTDLNKNSNIIYHGLEDVENKINTEKQDMWNSLESVAKNSENSSNNIYSMNKDDSDISTYKDFQYTNYNSSDSINNDIDKKVNIKDILPGGNVYPITKLDNIDEDELTNVKDDNDDIKSFEA